MKKFLFLLLLLPVFCSAQRFRNDVLEVSQDTIKCSYWQVLQRTTARNPMTTFFRIANINENYFLQLKVMLGGASFVVPRSAELELEFDNNDYITLFNTEYKKSCKGCGARNFEKDDLQGVTLSFPISQAHMDKLLRKYLYHIRLHLDQNLPGATINENRSEDFMDALWLVYKASQYKSNSIY